VHIDASVGIALFPEHSRTALGLLQRADVAMYEAKRMRTGHEVYLPSRDRHSRERLALVGELRSAIDAGQLILHYQPKAELATGVVHGVEALVRWQHPVHGLLAPRHFLPLAEQSGLTRALTAFVLDRALEEIDGLRGGGLDLSVAVNLGPADLLDVGLPTEVAHALERHTFAPEHLKLEVSEDVIMADPERTLDVLEPLRALGLQVALDDFGAGRSALSALKDLRLDELKIDRSFVLAMDADRQDAAIVRSVVDLGHRLGLRVVAEGVANGEAGTCWPTTAVTRRRDTSWRSPWRRESCTSGWSAARGSAARSERDRHARRAAGPSRRGGWPAPKRAPGLRVGARVCGPGGRTNDGTWQISPADSEGSTIISPPASRAARSARIRLSASGIGPQHPVEFALERVDPRAAPGEWCRGQARCTSGSRGSTGRASQQERQKNGASIASST
jgi:predicted signal transduction protein with EAL and GGDEF domain